MDTQEDTEQDNKIKIIDLHGDGQHGQIKCPKCGATDISRREETGKLFCNFCRYEFKIEEEEILDDADQIEELEGINVGSGAQDIRDDSEGFVTIKCQSCGADVMINSEESVEARCHWCRSYLSLNNVVPSGAVPDVIVPFEYSKAQAKSALERYIRDGYWYFAHPRFKKEFSTENIFGVFLPYMLVDVNAHAQYEGEGEITTKVHKEVTGSGEDRTVTYYYDVDAYKIKREFDFLIDDLTIESSQDKLDAKGTKNVINAILPFDTKKAKKWNALYLKGYNAEKRDLNIGKLEDTSFKQIHDIGHKLAAETIEQYDRGVRWDSFKQEIKGEKWISAYLPVWLYSYQKGAKIYYTALNAQTGETVGTVPLNYPKLLFISLIVSIVPLLLDALLDDERIAFFVILGPIFAAFVYHDYNKKGVKHEHSEETRSQYSKVEKEDQLFKQYKKRRSQTMNGATAHPPKKEEESK